MPVSPDLPHAPLLRSLRRHGARGEAPTGHLTYLIGPPGTGKTASLTALADALTSPTQRAYRLDVLAYLPDTTPLDTLELLLLVAVALADRLSKPDALGHADPFEPIDPALQALSHWLVTEAELDCVTPGVLYTEFQRRANGLLRPLRALDPDRREPMVHDLRQLIGQMVQALKTRHQLRSVVVLVDSLERLRAPGQALDGVMARMLTVFDHDLPLLRLPHAATVYSVPAGLAAWPHLVPLADACFWHSARAVHRPGDRAPDEVVLAELRAAAEPEWPEAQALDAATWHTLLCASGGQIGVLHRLLSDTLDMFDAQPDLSATLPALLARHADALWSPLLPEDHALLRRVHQHQTLSLSHADDRPRLAALLESQALLAYRNAAGQQWFDAHPLLWPLVSAPMPTSVPDEAGDNPPSN